MNARPVFGGKTLAIFYSSGELGDIGRHAVEASLELPPSVVSHIKIFSRDPHATLLEQNNWKCGCKREHRFTESDRKRMETIAVDFGREKENDHHLINHDNDDDDDDDDDDDACHDIIVQHLTGVDAVVSCLGSRQAFHGDRVAELGTKRIVKAMRMRGIKRLVMVSSVGIGDDWPPIEWRWEGNLMAASFRTICWREFRDLTRAEHIAKKEDLRGGDSSLDYLIVRPVQVGEKKIPEGRWYIQKKKFEDWVGFNMAKMDCAKFMVREAVEPTLSHQAVVLGSEPAKTPSEGDYIH